MQLLQKTIDGGINQQKTKLKPTSTYPNQMVNKQEKYSNFNQDNTRLSRQKYGQMNSQAQFQTNKKYDQYRDSNRQYQNHNANINRTSWNDQKQQPQGFNPNNYQSNNQKNKNYYQNKNYNYNQNRGRLKGRGDYGRQQSDQNISPMRQFDNDQSSLNINRNNNNKYQQKDQYQSIGNQRNKNNWKGSNRYNSANNNQEPDNQQQENQFKRNRYQQENNRYQQKNNRYQQWNNNYQSNNRYSPHNRYQQNNTYTGRRNQIQQTEVKYQNKNDNRYQKNNNYAVNRNNIQTNRSNIINSNRFPLPGQNKNENLSKNSYIQRNRAIKFQSQVKSRNNINQIEEDQKQQEQNQNYIESEQQYEYKKDISDDEQSIQYDQSSNNNQQQQQQQDQQDYQQIQKKLEQKYKSDCINQMCSYQQFNDRLKDFTGYNNTNNNSKLILDTGRTFSIFQINKKTMKPDFNLTLKRFRRSTIQNQNITHESESKDRRRTAQALVKAMKYINKEIIDSDLIAANDLIFPMPPGCKKIQFKHIYEFLWNRMRQMIKDITRLTDQERQTSEIIQICEQMARFFILAINQGKKKSQSKLQFDEKMNKQNLTKIFTPLLSIYSMSRIKLKSLIFEMKNKYQNISSQQIEKQMFKKGIYISSNQPQITAYALVISTDIKRSFYQKVFQGFQSNLHQNPLFTSIEITKALQIKNALNHKNYQKFYSILQSPQTSYSMSCLMIQHLYWLRNQTTKILFKTYRYMGSENKVRTQDLWSVLRFKQGQNKQFLEFIKLIGGKLSPGNQYVSKNNQIDEQYKYQDPQYIFEINKLARQLYTNSQIEKRVKDNHLITREQFICQSWKNTNYKQQVIAYYLGIQFQQIKNKIKIKNNLIEIEKIKPLGSVNQSDTRKNIQIKRLLLKRNKFIKGLQLLLFKLFREKDSKNKKKIFIASKMIQHLIKFKQQIFQIQAFQHLEWYVRRTYRVQNIMLKIIMYSKIKKSFIQAINNNPYNFDRDTKVNHKYLMSQLLQNVSNNKNYEFQSTNSTFRYILPQIIEENNLDKKDRNKQISHIKLLLVLYELPQQNIRIENERMNFLSKIWQYLTQLQQNINKNKIHDIIEFYKKQCRYGKQLNDKLLKVFKQQYKILNKNNNNYQLIHYSYQISTIVICQKYKKQQKQIMFQQIIHFYGCHGIILINFQNNINHLIKTFYHIQNMKPIITSNLIGIPILVFNLLTKNLEQNHQFLYTDLHFYNFFLSHQCQNLSTMLKMRIKQFMKFSLNERSNKKVNNFQGVAFKIRRMDTILHQIYMNHDFVRKKFMNENETDQQGFIYYQQYFNLCIDNLINTIKNIFNQSNTIYNWPKIIERLISGQQIQQNQNNSQYENENILINISLETKKQYQFIISFLKTMKMQFINNVKDRFQRQKIMHNISNINEKQKQKQFELSKLAGKIEKYLGQFNQIGQYYEQIDNFEQIITNTNLKIRKNCIVGQGKELFELIINNIAKNIKLIEIILPINFEFKIKNNQIRQETLKKKYYPQIQNKLYEINNTNQYFDTIINYSNFNHLLSSSSFSLEINNTPDMKLFNYVRKNMLDYTIKKRKI